MAAASLARGVLCQKGDCAKGGSLLAVKSQQRLAMLMEAFNLKETFRITEASCKPSTAKATANLLDSLSATSLHRSILSLFPWAACFKC